MSIPDTAYRTKRGRGNKTLHADGDCSALQIVEDVIEVDPDVHLPVYEWCQFCSGHLDGVEPADQVYSSGEMLSTKLHDADSLDDLRGETDA